MKRIRRVLERALPVLIGAWVFVELISLRLGLLDRFFYDAMHADVQGIDYFSLPKAWLNLAAGRSAYGSFDPPAYGPHFTWYLSHPALAVGLGSWLAFADPMVSYGAFTMLSLALMAASAWLLARESKDPLRRRLVWLLLLCAFPAYWMLLVGNTQSILVFALTMLFAGVLRRIEGRRDAGVWIFAGLLLSLLTKPVVLLMLPLLLLLRETRKLSSWALACYAAISALFELTPALNPQSIGIAKVGWLAMHPAFVRDTMNIYTNHFVVNAWMRDNSIHWFNLVAQSGTRLMHIDVFSLPVFLDTLLGLRTPDWLYSLLLLGLFVLSLLVSRIPQAQRRMHAALLPLLAISLVFFLAYPTVWEYQYTAVLPVAAVLALLRERAWPQLSPRAGKTMLVLAACTAFPSLYFLTEGRPITAATLTVVRLDRVVPVAALFAMLVFPICRCIRGEKTPAVAA